MTSKAESLVVMVDLSKEEGTVRFPIASTVAASAITALLILDSGYCHSTIVPINETGWLSVAAKDDVPRQYNVNNVA